MKKTLFMETTKIPAGQTVAEIQRILGEYGAAGVMTEYVNKEITSVCFKVVFLDKDIPFRLPCRWQPVFNYLKNQVKKPRENTFIELEDQAKRVAWRQILRWVQAQLALVETDMVKIEEVFLPYIQVGIDGQTLYERIEKKGLAALPYKPAMETSSE